MSTTRMRPPARRLETLTSLAVLMLTLESAQVQAAVASGTQTPEPAPTKASEPARLSVPFPLADVRVVDRGESSALLLLGVDGELAVCGAAGDSLGKPNVVFVLDDPAHSLVGIGALTPDAHSESLVVASRNGATRYDFDAKGALDANGFRLARRARFMLHTAQPRFAPILSDINADQRLDMVLPDATGAELWLNRAPQATPETATPESELPDVAFARLGRVSLSTEIARESNSEQLSDELRFKLSVPELETVDLNADGLPDLAVEDEREQRFHLQREDGSYPAEPDVICDLSLFRDPDISSGFRPGEGVSFGSVAAIRRDDLDGDGIPDFILSRGRKIWVFPGTSAGPQFEEPSTILKSSEEVTLTLTLDVDRDGRQDLVLLRLIQPTIPTLVLGLVRSFDLSVRVSAYRNIGEHRLDPSPFESRRFELRLPPILELLRDPYAVLERFQTAGQEFRESIGGDLDGDGDEDLSLWATDDNRVQIWRGRSAGAGELTEADFKLELRRQLFEQDKSVYDLDRIAGLVGGAALQQIERWTGGTPADVEIDLEPPSGAYLDVLLGADLNADATLELIAVWRHVATPARAWLERVTLP